MNRLPEYKRFVFLGIILIALGTTFTTTLYDSVPSLGVVFIALGGLFFIIGMKKKNEVNGKTES